MRASVSADTLLRTGGFSLHGLLGRTLGLQFSAQCWTVALTSAALIGIAGVLDHTLWLEGRSVGLLEHPAIWTFIGLQIALPLSIRHSLALAQSVSTGALAGTGAVPIHDTLRRFLRLEDPGSRAIAGLIYLIGFAAFIWNTYQNQRPWLAVPFDFWDSSQHPFGFWITRVYKGYLFVWLLPYISLIHVCIVRAVLASIRSGRLAGKLRLQPFHSDGAGGLGAVPSLVTTPLVITLLAVSVSSAAAFEVHRAFDVTPLIGLAVILLGIVVAYLVPIWSLRTDLVAMKQDTLSHLRSLQKAYYDKIVAQQSSDSATIADANEALDYFDKIVARVQAISNYPHLARMMKYAGVALTPSALSLLIKLLPLLRPVIRPILKTF